MTVRVPQTPELSDGLIVVGVREHGFKNRGRNKAEWHGVLLLCGGRSRDTRNLCATFATAHSYSWCGCCCGSDRLDVAVWGCAGKEKGHRVVA